MTRAHENHFFLGALFGTVLLGVVRTRRFAAALTVALLTQFAYIFGRYGFGINHLTASWPIKTIHEIDRSSVSTGLALLNVAAVTVMLIELFSFARRGEAPFALKRPAALERSV